MKQRLYAFLGALLITLVVGVIVLIPLTYIGFIVFPTERPDGHNVMPIGAIFFGLTTTAIVCLITIYYFYIKLYKRYYKNMN